MNSKCRSLPPKQTLPVHFSSIGMCSICSPFLLKTVTPLPVELQTRLATPMAGVSTTISGYLRNMAVALRTGRGAPAIWPVQSALETYAAAVAAMRSDGLTRGIAGDVTERFFALGFSLEQMRQNLRDLERCVSDWSEATGTIAGKPADEIL